MSDQSVPLVTVTSVVSLLTKQVWPQLGEILSISPESAHIIMVWKNEKNMSDKTNERTKILLQKGCQHSVLMWTQGDPEISC